jgi:hypothetical protein
VPNTNLTTTDDLGAAHHQLHPHTNQGMALQPRLAQTIAASSARPPNLPPTPTRLHHPLHHSRPPHPRSPPPRPIPRTHQRSRRMQELQRPTPRHPPQPTGHTPRPQIRPHPQKHTALRTPPAGSTPPPIPHSQRLLHHMRSPNPAATIRHGRVRTYTPRGYTFALRYLYKDRREALLMQVKGTFARTSDGYYTCRSDGYPSIF